MKAEGEEGLRPPMTKDRMAFEGGEGSLDMASREKPTTGGVREPAGIWIVQGSTGEYSDRSEWNTYAFHEEGAARAYVEFLTAKRQELAPQGHHLEWGSRDAVEESMKAYDPEYSEDYTGSSWTAAFVAFAPSDAIADTSERSDLARDAVQSDPPQTPGEMGASRTESGGSSPLRATKSDRQEGH